MFMMMAKICSQTRLNPLHIKSWRAAGQSSYWHFVTTLWQKMVHRYRMFHGKCITRAVFLSVVAHDGVIYMHGSASQTVAPGCCLSLCSTVWKKKKRKLDGLLCERDVGRMYICTSCVSRLLRGYHVLVVCCKLLQTPAKLELQQLRRQNGTSKYFVRFIFISFILS